MGFESDWALLRLALPDLQAYLLSNDLHWPLHPAVPTPGSLQIPQLTLGTLILSQTRLSALPLDAKRQEELVVISQKIQLVRNEWRSNWSRKAAQEAPARLNLWRQYVHELCGDFRGYTPFYPTEVRQRAILHLLRDEILEGISAKDDEQLSRLDALLRGVTRSGPFVWEAEAQRAFAQEEYWFLYVTVNL
jgi:hypothetical protein